MIADVAIIEGGAITPPPAFDMACAMQQPVANVRQYLLTRKPVMWFADEMPLFVTLPECPENPLRSETRLQCSAAAIVRQRLKKESVQAACKAVLNHFYADWKLGTFRQKFDRWMDERDWVVWVNRARAGGDWVDRDYGLADEFLKFCAARVALFKRRDAMMAALRSIRRQWQTGLNPMGTAEMIPGYEVGWEKRNRELIPPGWTPGNIARQLKKRGKLNQAARLMVREGESAARAVMPQILGTRKGLRFLEKITFDDVRMDWLVFNTATGEAEDLWLLVARDEATNLILGFVMLPATEREDGKCTHIGAQQMKELVAQILQVYPLPPYLMHWVVERGSATLSEAVKAALGELFENRIKVHYTSMIGDSLANGYLNANRPLGFREKAKGNSRGKASHEAGNRNFHILNSHLPGQIGDRYDVRPAIVTAQEKECREIWKLRERLPESKRGDVRFPLVVLQTEAEQVIREFCLEQNFRTEHKLEGFEAVLEWWDGQRWQPRETAPAGAQFRKRMESPVERAKKLMSQVDRWERVSVDVIITFLAHSQRWVQVNERGEIKFDQAGESFIFRHAGNPLPPGTKCLAYHSARAPQCVHLTTGKGEILGTWAQRGRTAFQDREALAEAIRYTGAARAAVTAEATELAAQSRQRFEDIRAHNAALEKFVTVTDAPRAAGTLPASATARALATTEETTDAMREQPPTVEPVADCTEDVLERQSSAPDVTFD